MDSGAFGLYNREAKKGPVGPGFFSLEKGSEFRAYCDRYASLMKKLEGTPELYFAVVDVIGNPEKTWEIQQFFEQEHGVRPAPVIHHGTSLAYVDRYMEAGHELICLGGMAHLRRFSAYVKWVDGVFSHLCPESNGRIPLVRLHGFGVTSWDAICRWPWWSVDSTAWCKYAAYGWILVPHWEKRKGFRFDIPPMVVNYSFRSPQRKIRHRHVDTLSPSVREVAEKWILHLGIPLGEEETENKELVEGVTSHHKARTIANLSYYKMLEDSRPPWPYPLDRRVTEHHTQRTRQGMGL